MSAAGRDIPCADPPSATDSGAGAAFSSARRSVTAAIWQRRWVVVSSVAIGLAAAIAYLLAATPIYQSSAKVYVEQSMPRLVANDPAAVMSGAQNYLWTQCELIRSRSILEPVANDPAIRSLVTFDAVHDVFGALRERVSAQVGRRDDLITISVRSEIREDAPRIANAIVVAFMRYHETTKRSTSRQLLEILQTQMTRIEDGLAKCRAAMLEFKTKNAGFALGSDRADPSLERLNRLSQALTETQLSTLSAQASHETAKAMMDDPVKARQLLETRQFKSDTAQLRAELRDLQQKLAGMSKNYLPGFPELSAIRASIQQLSDEMAEQDKRTIEAYVAELDARVQAARRNEQQIEALLNAQKSEVLKRNTVAAQYSDLQAEMERLDRARDEIYQGIKSLSMSEDVGALNVRSVEAAVPAAKAVSPDSGTTLGLALLLGGVVGAALAVLRDWMDQRLHSADEVKQVLGLPLLGVVPRIAGADAPGLRGMHVHHEPLSDVAEAYRTVRTAVYFGQAGNVPRTLLVTSPAPGDGKSTLAANLAIAMAQAGNRVLLLDADFRKPTQHSVFDIQTSGGLSSVLAGEAALSQVIQRTPIAGLSVLPCGPIPANPSEILNSQSFADLLDELAAKYDHVLLDSPPLLAVTDARILAASCDATVLALRAERSTRKGARDACDLLQSVGSRILGVVVNDVSRRHGLYGYYYTRDGRYGYGPARRRVSRTNAMPPMAAQPGNGSGGAASPLDPPAVRQAPPAGVETPA